MSVDFMFVAKNRLAFTKESFFSVKANTNWNLVRNFVVYDDGSTDGTLEFLTEQAKEMGAELRRTDLGSAVTVQSDFMRRVPPGAEYIAKIDNDAMYPPGWLETCIGVLQRHPELQVLGLEHRGIEGELPHGYQPEGILDGLFVARRDIYSDQLPEANNKYWGWENWLASRNIKCGWLKPSLPVFLLDRVNLAPWVDLTREYEAKGWQRPWYRYADDCKLWDWCPWIARPCLQALFDEIQTPWSDIQAHLPKLRSLAAQVDSVTEFGVRSGTSTRAFLSGRPRLMRSFDVNPYGDEVRMLALARAEGIDWRFDQANDLEIEIQPTDLLFIDTLHSYAQLTAELRIHSSLVGRYIVLHDTEMFGEVGDDGRFPGLRAAYEPLLSAGWRVASHNPASYGLTILERISL